MSTELKALTKRVQALAGLPVDAQDGIWGVKTAKAVIEKLGGVVVPPIPVPPIPSQDRHINARGLDLVKYFEGLYLNAYRDEVGIWTIGWGHTGLQHDDGTVHAGRKVTEAEAEKLLRYDMEQFEKRVNTFVQVPVTDDQFSSLVSFDFNTGGLKNSTLLRLLNAGKYDDACAQFKRWNRADGEVLRGLTIRRKASADLFNGVSDLHLRLTSSELALSVDSEAVRAEARRTPDNPDPDPR